LRSRGLQVVRFNFLYREKKSSAPDPMPRLKQCYAAVAEHVRRIVQPQMLILGGRSMAGGSRRLLAADSYPCDGLLLLAYRCTRPAGPRSCATHTSNRSKVPVLCFKARGTRFAGATDEQAIGRLSDRWTMHWLEGADHSFHILKSSGRTDEDVLAEVVRPAEHGLAGRSFRPGLKRIGIRRYRSRMGSNEGDDVLELFIRRPGLVRVGLRCADGRTARSMAAIKAGGTRGRRADRFGKTLAAFLAAIDALVREASSMADRRDARAVRLAVESASNDIQRNLEAPVAGVPCRVERLGLPDVEIRTQVRTGDTPQSERASMRRRPPTSSSRPRNRCTSC